jgi:hypothetical protein
VAEFALNACGTLLRYLVVRPDALGSLIFAGQPRTERFLDDLPSRKIIALVRFGIQPLPQE